MTPRVWQQLEVALGGAQADAAVELLESLGAIAVSSEAGDDEPRFDLAEPQMHTWSITRLMALFDEQTELEPVIETVVRVFSIAPQECIVTRFEDRDWERVWLEHFHPIAITPDLWICPSWCEPPENAATILTLDPGLAFGTGTHATTRMCLEQLAAMDLHNKLVLDFGCGSGVLAIAAVRLGAARAIACDVDPRALEATRANAIANGVDGRIETLTADDAATRIENDALQADVVVANILAEALTLLAGRLTRAMTTQGCLLLSGILRHQQGQVADAYPTLDFRVHSRDDWVLLAT
jgi:ribosomal protein L11 methyltransferase